MPCTARWLLNHWTTKKVSALFLMVQFWDPSNGITLLPNQVPIESTEKDISLIKILLLQPHSLAPKIPPWVIPSISFFVYILSLNITADVYSFVSSSISSKLWSSSFLSELNLMLTITNVFLNIFSQCSLL